MGKEALAEPVRSGESPHPITGERARGQRPCPWVILVLRALLSPSVGSPASPPGLGDSV